MLECTVKLKNIIFLLLVSFTRFGFYGTRTLWSSHHDIQSGEFNECPPLCVSVRNDRCKNGDCLPGVGGGAVLRKIIVITGLLLVNIALQLHFRAYRPFTVRKFLSRLIAQRNRSVGWRHFRVNFADRRRTISRRDGLYKTA